MSGVVSHPVPGALARLLVPALVVGAAVLAASLFGILTRPLGFLAAFWPANAILVGLMVRNPQLATPAGWVGAIAGYMLADLLTEAAPMQAALLTIGNLLCAGSAVFLYSQLGEDDRRFRGSSAVLNLLGVGFVAAGVAALFGGVAAGVLFGWRYWDGLEFWFVTELVNLLIVLPLFLSFPGLAAIRRAPAERRTAGRLPGYVPALALIACGVAGVMIGGPVALALPVPGLIWCALSYRPFEAAVLTSGMCASLLIAISAGFVSVPWNPGGAEHLSSARLAIALISLGPLAVANATAARRSVLRQLRHLSDHDSLTGVLTRRAFFDAAQSRGVRRVDNSVLMLDIDGFKAINDTYGHAVGDRALVAFTEATRAALRDDDVFGRIGGEEFALILPDTDAETAGVIAERIREAVQAVALDGVPRLSVSIGVAQHRGGEPLDAAMGRADTALYDAKSGGKNRVVTARG